MKKEYTVNWLRKPNLAFGGATPLEIIERGGSQGAHRVARELERLELDADQMFSQAPQKFRRKASKAFSKLDVSGKTGKGTDATKLISEDREDRV
jgi:hypothetical protein